MVKWGITMAKCLNPGKRMSGSSRFMLNETPTIWKIQINLKGWERSWQRCYRPFAAKEKKSESDKHSMQKVIQGETQHLAFRNFLQELI